MLLLDRESHKDVTVVAIVIAPRMAFGWVMRTHLPGICCPLRLYAKRILDSGMSMRNLINSGSRLLASLLLVYCFSNPCYAEDPYAEDQLMQPPHISLDQATKQIIKDNSNRVLGAQTEWTDGREVHVIKVLTPDGHIQHYKIDAVTGELINN